MTESHLLRPLAILRQWSHPSRALLLAVVGLGLTCCANCGSGNRQPAQTTTPPNGQIPNDQVPSDQVPSASPMTQRELDECIDDCVKSQSEHPEETPFDCRVACTEREMR